MSEPIFYVNGEFVRKSEAKVSVFDLGFTRGYGVFEGFRTYNRIPFRLEDHLLRLNCALIGLNIPRTDQIQNIEYWIHELMKKNPDGDLAFKITVTGGFNEEINFTPKNPTLIIGVGPIPSFPREYYEKGARLITTTQSRIFPEFKTTSYLGAGLAIQDALQRQADDAVYLTPKGELLELTRSNLFAIKEGVLITPKEGILFGVTRKVMIEIATSLGMKVEEGPLYQKDLPLWEEAFHTSSFKEIVPIIQIDDKVIGKGVIGPTTRKLMEAFFTHTKVELSQGSINTCSTSGGMGLTCAEIPSPSLTLRR